MTWREECVCVCERERERERERREKILPEFTEGTNLRHVITYGVEGFLFSTKRFQ